MRVGYQITDDFIARVKVPLDGESAVLLAALVIQYPQHRFEVEENFLVMKRAVDETL